MQQFGPRAERSLVESPIELTMERLRHEIPELDEAAAEAHVVLSRAYAVYLAALAARYETLGLSASATAVERMNRPFISLCLSLAGPSGNRQSGLSLERGHDVPSEPLQLLQDHALRCAYRLADSYTTQARVALPELH